MKDKYISKGKNDKNKYLNNPPIVNNKNSRKIQFKNSYKFFNEMNKLCNIHTKIESECQLSREEY